MASQKTTESVNYYLKHGSGYANHNVYLQFKFDGQRLRYYLQQPVDPKRWNEISNYREERKSQRLP